MNLDKLKEMQLAVLGICILVGLVLSTAILGNTLITFKKYSGDVITVTGAATKPITSDFASAQFTFSRRGSTLQQAYTGIKQDISKITEFLRTQGIEQWTIESPTTDTLYARLPNGYTTNQIEGYNMRQTIKVESNDVDLIERLANDSAELINQGIILESYPPQYFYTKLDSLKVEMLGQATENAKQRAASMAQSTGNNIGLMRSASMGVFQITPINSTDVSDYGISDTSAKEKKVTAVVNVSFAVK